MNRLMLLALALAACSKSAPTEAPAVADEKPTDRPVEATKQAGRVETVKMHSDALGVDKSVVVWLPAGYDEHAARKYPVMFYLHGLTGDETNWVKGGHIDAAADDLKLEAIIVMPDGDDSFYVDSQTPIDYGKCMDSGEGLFFSQRPHKSTCVKTAAYEKYVAEDLVKWADATYRTLGTREGRAIAGLSMGGYGAFMLAMRHKDEFGAAASHSGVVALRYGTPHPYAAGKVTLIDNPRTWKNEAGEIGEWIHSRFGDDLAFWKAHDPADLVESLKPDELALYFDCGTEDIFKLNDEASYMHDLLAAKHIDHVWFLGPGGHDFEFWKVRVKTSLGFLRDHLAKASG